MGWFHLEEPEWRRSRCLRISETVLRVPLAQISLDRSNAASGIREHERRPVRQKRGVPPPKTTGHCQRGISTTTGNWDFSFAHRFCGIAQGLTHILCLEIEVSAKNLSFAHPFAHHPDDGSDGNAQTPNTWDSAIRFGSTVMRLKCGIHGIEAELNYSRREVVRRGAKSGRHLNPGIFGAARKCTCPSFPRCSRRSRAPGARFRLFRDSLGAAFSAASSRDRRDR